MQEQRTFTDGRVVFVAGQPRRGRRKRADYLLRYRPDLALAVVEGMTGRGHLSHFQDLEKRTPVILTTSQMLTNGVDAPACRNVVLKRLAAITEQVPSGFARLPPRLPGTGHTGRGRGIQCQAARRHGLAALGATAIVAAVDPGERSVDTGQRDGPATFRGQGHGLLLHGVHAREPPNAALIELDSIATVGGGLAHRQQRPAIGEQPLALGQHVHPRRSIVIYCGHWSSRSRLCCSRTAWKRIIGHSSSARRRRQSEVNMTTIS
jgi:hypothetical protein